MQQPAPLTEIESIPLFITVADAARILKISKRQMQQFIWKDKGPKLLRFGRNIRIRKEDFLAWAAKDQPSVFHQDEDRKDN